MRIFLLEIPRPHLELGNRMHGQGGRNTSLILYAAAALAVFVFFSTSSPSLYAQLFTESSDAPRRTLTPSTVAIGNMFARNPRCFAAVADELRQRTNAFWWRFRSKGIRALSHSYAQYESALFAVDGKQYVRCERSWCFGDAIIFIVNATQHVAETNAILCLTFRPNGNTHWLQGDTFHSPNNFTWNFIPGTTPYIRARTKCFHKANEPRMPNIYPVAIIIACLTPKSSRSLSLCNEQTARKYPMTMIRWIWCHQTCSKIIKTRACEQCVDVDVRRRFMNFPHPCKRFGPSSVLKPPRKYTHGIRSLEIDPWKFHKNNNHGFSNQIDDDISINATGEPTNNSSSVIVHA